MDTVEALALLEALLIIAAVLAHTAIRFISPSLHASNHVALDSSDSDSVLISWAPTSDNFANTKYDVFLSFRGEDTRDNFTSHLYEALCRANIQTFIDDKIRKGEGVSPFLYRTIENSEIYVIVFSKDYASSTWCLEELRKILECKDRYQREVIPIFYKIDPSHVRKQSGSYRDAFIKHNHKFINNKVRKWKHALTQAANLSGWDSNNIRPESKLVKEIVKVVLSKLKGMSPSHFEGLVGINDRVNEIKTILSDFRIVGIWGMGGIGKTTLAKAVFHELKVQFDSHSFINVREELDRIGLDQLQKKCLEELLEGDAIDTYNIGSNLMKKRIQSKKVLIVLDNVDDFIRVEGLIKLHDWFGQGSRIIITSRDKQVFKNAGAYEPYHVQGMDSHDALCLFSLKAFKQNEPPIGYIGLSKLVLSYCQGIPLALTVLGCFLHGRTKEEWESALDDLKQASYEGIFNVLKLSFDGLNDKQKSIFLDLACFFRRKVTLYEIDIQSYYDFPTKIVLSVLKDRSLISNDEYERIVMHDLVAAMGQEVAYRQFTNEPEKPIRLLRNEDIYPVLRNNNNVVIEKLRGISLDVCEIKNIHLKEDVFRKMYNLIILEFYKSDPKKPSKVNIFEGFINFVSEELRILYWEDYPLPSVSFCANNLVNLELVNSNLQKLWNGDQHFPNLKVINLRGSKLLTELPDLFQAPNIKRINLSDCVNLLQINCSKSLVKLENFCLDRCKKLRSAEILTFCNQLLHIYWEQCPLKSLPLSCLRNLVRLQMRESKLEQLWDGKQHFPQLEVINLGRSKCLTRMPDLSQAPNIKKIYLTSCTSLLQLYSSSSLSKLYILGLKDCSKLRVEKLWDRNRHFPKLSVIDVSGCKNLIELPDLSQTPNITGLWVDGCVNLLQVHSSSALLQLEYFTFHGCNKLRRVNLAGNVHSRSSGALDIACNYFDLKNLTLNKVCIRFFLSDDGNIYAFGFKAAAVAFTKLWDCMHATESRELKLLAQTLSSSLPFVRQLRWFDITSSIEFDSFTDHYMLETFGSFFEEKVTQIQLQKRAIEFELERSLGKECMRGTRNKGESILMEKGRGPKNSTKLCCDYICDTTEGTTIEGVGTELEEKLTRESECCSSIRLTRSPNSIIYWSLLTNLSLQKTNIVNVQWSIPGLSFFKALAKSDCSTLQPILDLTFPVNAEISELDIDFCEYLNRRDFHQGLFLNYFHHKEKKHVFHFFVEPKMGSSE